VLVAVGCGSDLDSPPGSDGTTAGSTSSSVDDDGPLPATSAASNADSTMGGTADGSSDGSPASSEEGSTAGPPADSDEGSSSGGPPPPPPDTVAECFANAYVNPVDWGPDYDQYDVQPGSHCLGTDHQEIDGIERVVFMGDSVTVGTPPTLSEAYYRSLVADGLVAKYGLDFGAGLEGELVWKIANPFTGQAGVMNSGDFASCAEWGARNDDLLQDSSQIAQCFDETSQQLRTLVIFTSGGNDISAITQAAIDGATNDELWAMGEEMVALQREAIDWLLEPGRFPNGVFVIFGNLYEFTDGTGDVEACDVSGLAGFDQPVPAPMELAELVVWIEEEYGRMAAETGTDMVFMLEEFCGHGFNADDPTAPCYRGPNTPVWFDLTCIHPNPAGHQHLADMFLAVVGE